MFGKKYPKNFRKEHIEYHKDQPEELAVINYTSGTTSYSKGVMLPYRSLWSNTAFAFEVLPLKAGDKIKIDKNYYIEVLAPGDFLNKKDLKNMNNTSLVLMLHYGSFKMLLTGDAEAPVEDALQQKYGTALQADVLKVGHHGSKTSSYWPFVSKVKPKYALISCGDFSIYKHPNKNVVGSLTHLGAKVLTTHDHGTLTVTSDG